MQWSFRITASRTKFEVIKTPGAHLKVSMRSSLAVALVITVAAPIANAQSQAPGPTVPRGARTLVVGPRTELPRTYTGKPTTEAITAADLMTRLYIFADDSMMGREVGTKYHLMATSYIEREVRRLGLVPAGDNGGYFQDLPLFDYSTDSASSMAIGAQRMTFGSDYLVMANGERRIALDGVPVVFGGTSNDTTTWISPEQMAGKIVVFATPSTSSPMLSNNPVIRARVARAVVVILTSLDRMNVGFRGFVARSQQLLSDTTRTVVPPSVFVNQRMAALLFGNVNDKRAGAVLSGMSGTLVMHERRAPARNVVAILPGSDPKLKGEYVAIGAHNDHVGFNATPVDHDSVRAFNIVVRPHGADSPPSMPTLTQLARVRAMTDSLHRLHGARPDSIFNGADDDGTGTVSVLEIAESFAKSAVRPKRSLLFVWHAGEEKGLWGSAFFTDHPTVSRDSIVAQLNMDMVGRGGAGDATGENKTGVGLHGGPGYLQLVGSRRLSTELGDLMETVNKRGKHGLTFDYAMDANGHPQVIYCRSDHYEYARYGIPIVFMTTGGHSDYHQVTDEPQYIDYGHMAEVARFVRDAALTVANLDHRVVVDHAKPDPKGACVQ